MGNLPIRPDQLYKQPSSSPAIQETAKTVLVLITATLLEGKPASLTPGPGRLDIYWQDWREARALREQRPPERDERKPGDCSRAPGKAGTSAFKHTCLQSIKDTMKPSQNRLKCHQSPEGNQTESPPPPPPATSAREVPKLGKFICSWIRQVK